MRGSLLRYASWPAEVGVRRPVRLTHLTHTQERPALSQLQRLILVLLQMYYLHFNSAVGRIPVVAMGELVRQDAFYSRDQPQVFIPN